jgi:phosphatidylinositol glycan class T
LLPPGAHQDMSYEFDKEFLPLEDFPPDANRGFPVPPAVFEYQGHSGTVLGATDSLVVSLPLPDFSMPYNVVTLSSTAFSFFLGNVVNALVRVRNDAMVGKPEVAATGGRLSRLLARCRRRA